MKLVQVAEQNKKYYTKDFIHGFNTGAKTQYEADKKEAERTGRWEDYSIEKWIYAKCSECGTVHDVRSNYCPDCGVRMEASE